MIKFLNKLKGFRILHSIIIITIPALFILSVNITSSNIISEQASFQLQHIKKCVEFHNPKNENELNNILNECAQNLRNLGSTGDSFLLDPKTKRVVWDANSDCKLNQIKSFLNKENICSLFKNPETCINGARIMSRENGSFYWNFDDNRELITFTPLNVDGKSYRIAIGGKDIDLYTPFIPIFIFFGVLWVMLLFGVI
jgi:hypothetical protein